MARKGSVKYLHNAKNEKNNWFEQSSENSFVMVLPSQQIKIFKVRGFHR